MSTKIPSEKTRLLLVEGKSETEFFIQLGYHLKFTEDIPLHIVEYDGKTNLQDFSTFLQTESSFLTITHIGIVRDADFSSDAFSSIQSALTYA